ncbi:MAG: nucleotidyltransferase family protein [Candidatus Scalindua sp.]|nr:nucleotidyltransferase family protein [Candidatus Scalindua sp.]
MNPILHQNIDQQEVVTGNIDVLILCGGFGTRLKGVINDRPKPMADINSKPFLDILVDYVAGFGFKRYILCIGYKGDFIRQYYREKNSDLTFVLQEEKKPLGTAGAVKNAEPVMQSDRFLVMNGDSLCEIDMKDLFAFHIRKKGIASIVQTTIENPDDYGVIQLDENQRVVSFSEKNSTREVGFVNAGIYVFEKDILRDIPPEEKCSLEYQVFPGIIDRGVYGYRTDKRLIDIGTPQRLEMARKCIPFLREKG